MSWGGTRRIHYSQNRLSSLSWSSAQTNGDRCRSCRRATVSSALGGGGPTRCGTHRPASSSWLNSTQVLVATTLWGINVNSYQKKVYTLHSSFWIWCDRLPGYHTQTYTDSHMQSEEAEGARDDPFWLREIPSLGLISRVSHSLVVAREWSSAQFFKNWSLVKLNSLWRLWGINNYWRKLQYLEGH